MTGLVGLLIAAFAPGAFWLWIVYNRDKCEREPRLLIIRTFILGMVAAVPIALIEVLLFPGSVDSATESAASSAYVAFIVAGATEEVGKFIVVRLTMYRSRHFNEAMDGLVYASAVALGFASLENLGYIAQFGVEVMLFRGPVSTLSHLIFSAFWGYPLALKKVKQEVIRFGVPIGLVVAVGVHGLFNFFLFRGGNLALSVIGLVAVGVLIFILMVVHARKISPFCQKQLD